MAGFPVTALTVLVLAVFPVTAADLVAWGPAVNGLRMSLSVVLDEPPSGRQLQVTIQNVGGNDLLVPRDCGVAMFRPKDLLVHEECLAIPLFRFGIIPFGLKQPPQIVDGFGCLRMPQAQDLRVSRERAAIEK